MPNTHAYAEGCPNLMVDHIPVCFDHTEHSTDVFVVHISERATIIKFITEIDTTALGFCKPVRSSRLAWYIVSKSSSKPNEALLSCRITFKIVEHHTMKIFAAQIHSHQDIQFLK
ncbi:hypothetical protein EVAR_4930_1 [Eumeta japonica]|uniref:Uncharacterized protein n=1 Tax=Eumeta variegata TaxID=151549 RepID=A0A4C1UZ14_EUMVA|nr:hypothetical protein EVAR_4930_1 [Eumeta japonica]